MPDFVYSSIRHTRQRPHGAPAGGQYTEGGAPRNHRARALTSLPRQHATAAARTLVSCAPSTGIPAPGSTRITVAASRLLNETRCQFHLRAAQVVDCRVDRSFYGYYMADARGQKVAKRATASDAHAGRERAERCQKEAATHAATLSKWLSGSAAKRA